MISYYASARIVLRYTNLESSHSGDDAGASSFHTSNRKGDVAADTLNPMRIGNS